MAKSKLLNRFQVNGQLTSHRFHVEVGGNVLSQRFGINGDILSQKFLVLSNSANSEIDLIVSSTSDEVGPPDNIVTNTEAPSGPAGPASASTSEDIEPFDVVETGFPVPQPHRFGVHGDPFSHCFGVLGNPFGHLFGVHGDPFSHCFGVLGNKFENTFTIDHIDVPSAIGTGNILGSLFNIDHIDAEDQLGHKWFGQIATEDEFGHVFNINELTSPPAVGTGNILPSIINVPFINTEDMFGHLFEVGLLGFGRLSQRFGVPINTFDNQGHKFKARPFRQTTRFLTRTDRTNIRKLSGKKLKFVPKKTKTTRQR